MNLICLYYICRENGNRKQYGSIVFHNPQNRSETDVDIIIRRSLVDDSLFIHSQWGLPDLHSEKTKATGGVRYHEYVGVQKVEETFQRTIESVEDLLERVRKSSY